MSAKRFTTDYSDLLKNNKTFIKMDNERLTYDEIVDLLNEQQTTINELEEENKKLIEDWEFSFRTELAHHRVAEKELKEKIREQQAIIQSLKEENKKLKNIHWY